MSGGVIEGGCFKFQWVDCQMTPHILTYILTTLFRIVLAGSIGGVCPQPSSCSRTRARRLRRTSGACAPARKRPSTTAATFTAHAPSPLPPPTTSVALLYEFATTKCSNRKPHSFEGACHSHGTARAPPGVGLPSRHPRVHDPGRRLHTRAVGETLLCGFSAFIMRVSVFHHITIFDIYCQI